MAGVGKMQRSIKAEQRLVRTIIGRVDGTGTASILEGGASSMTLVDNGTGDYTLTFTEGYKRIPTVMLQPIGAAGDVVMTLGTISTTAVQCLAWDGTDGITAKDADFHVLIMGPDAEDQI